MSEGFDIPLDKLKEIFDSTEYPELLVLTWRAGELGARSRTASEISALLRETAARAARAEEKVAQLLAEAKSANVRKATERDDLHDEIERAHRRWWHGLIGLRWEVTGWSWDWRRESL